MSIWCQFLALHQMGLLMAVVLRVLRGVERMENFYLYASLQYPQSHFTHKYISSKIRELYVLFSIPLDLMNLRLYLNILCLVSFAFISNKLSCFPLREHFAFCCHSNKMCQQAEKLTFPSCLLFMMQTPFSPSPPSALRGLSI